MSETNSDTPEVAPHESRVAAEGQPHTQGFVKSTVGVREVKLEAKGWIRTLRYMPLALLVILVVVAAGIGAWYQMTHHEVPAPNPSASAIAETKSPTSHCLAATPAPQPSYFAQDNSPAEAAFIANIGEKPYVVGKDNWVFWNDVQAHNFSQALGREQLDATHLQEWGNFFKQLQEKVTAQGRTLVIMPAPAKWAALPGFLPDWARELQSDTPLDQLERAYPDLPWLDTRVSVSSALPEANGLYPWSKVNSHWSPYGGWLAWKQSVACLQELNPDFDDLEVPQPETLNATKAPSEFASLGYDEVSSDWIVPTLPQSETPVTLQLADGTSQTSVWNEINFADLPAHTTNPQAKGPSALIFRDSMGNAISPLWNQAFRKTVQLRHNLDTEHPTDIEAALRDNPSDLVIFEFAQRYLTFKPPLLGA